MKNSIFTNLHFGFLGFITLCALPAIVGATTESKSMLPPPVQISSHFYAWLGPHGGPSIENKGFRMNMGFVVGKTEVAVIESGYHDAMARDMLQHIRKITPLPVKYVVNTNSQGDRFLGNEYFRLQGAVIISSAAEAKRMKAMGSLFAQISERALGFPPASMKPPNPPDRILEAHGDIDLGGVNLKLQQFGAAHTPSPLVVHIPQDNVVYAGDILYSGRLLAVVDGGNVGSWLKVFDALKQYGDVTFVPGHGKPGKLTAFEFSTRDYLSLLHSHMSKAAEQGKTPTEAIKSLDQTRFSKLENFDELATRNAHAAFLEAEADSLK